MSSERSYDLAIAGGGLAGLSLSILLASKGWRVVLFEKESYPFHKVCGEYISMESWDFLVSSGVPLADWNLPRMHELYLTSPEGKGINAPLPLGGFGISRYKLDACLADLARKAGVDIFENTIVHELKFEQGRHLIETTAGSFTSTTATACYGKKSNLDVKWKRSFLTNSISKNYVGVKYHVTASLPEGQIALHNFSGGYCGISKIENDRYCLCYLSESKNLKNNGQSIQDMERNVLLQNPELRKIWEQMTVLYDAPVTIAKINFSKKTQIEDHTLCLGDAAGMITPLCGNGMSMALHSAKIASELIDLFLHKKITRVVMETSYVKNWRREFAARLQMGRFIQSFFGNTFWSSFLIAVMKPFPVLIRTMIRKTHGEKF